MKKQVFHFILAVCFIVSLIPSVVWALEDSGFENDVSGWTPQMLCTSTTPPGVSIQNTTTNFPAHSGVRSAVFFGQIPIGSGCIETDASLTQSVTIDTADIVTLKYYYRIKQPFSTVGLASAEFQVRIGDQVVDTITQPTIAGANYDSGWSEERTVDISAYKGTTVNLLFIFSTTEKIAKPGYKISWILDDISITYAAAGPTPGNINGDIENKVDLADAILSLQILAGINPAGTVALANDVDANNVIGLENPIYILQDVANLR